MKAKLLGVLVLMLLPVLAFGGVASAQTFRSSDQTANVGKDEIVDSSLWTAGRSVNIAGQVNGDVFCAGESVTISGKVNGDVLCAAQTITLTGEVSGDIRLAGQTVVIGSNVKGSASVVGQTIVLESKGVIGGDASFGGESITLHGSVARDVILGAGEATVASAVGRNVTADVEKLTFTGDARVTGTVNYTSPEKASINGGAQITGETKYTERVSHEEENKGFNVGAMLFWSAMLLVAALGLVLLFPRLFQRTTNQALKSRSGPLLALLVGLVVSIVVPVAIILLMVSVFGIPLALVALVVWALIIGTSGAFAAYYLGRLVWPNQTNAVLIMLAGALILIVATAVPFLSVLVVLLAVWLGTGLILLELKKFFVAPPYNPKNLK